MTIEKIIKSNSDKFKIWDKLLQEHIACNLTPRAINLSDKQRIFYSTNGLLAEIAENFFRYGNFKDEWDTSKCYINIGGQNLLLKSLKTEQTFDWGVQDNEFYMESYLTHAENLRHMKDDFWEIILGLKNYGEFSFVENAWLDSKRRKQFENKKSNVFRIIRNYMIFQIDNFNSTNYSRNSDLDLGWFEIKWKFGTNWEEILENSCKAFKDLYRLNYQLWKITDLKNKQNENRTRIR